MYVSLLRPSQFSLVSSGIKRVTESLALFQDFAVCRVLDILDQFSINIPNKLPDHPFSLS